MATQKYKAKIYVEGSNFPIEVETEATSHQQAQKYTIKNDCCNCKNERL